MVLFFILTAIASLQIYFGKYKSAFFVICLIFVLGVWDFVFHLTKQLALRW